MPYPTTPIYDLKPELTPCTPDQLMAANVEWLLKRCDDDMRPVHMKVIAELKDDVSAVNAYCVQELTSIDQADDAQMYRELSEGRY